MKIYKQEIADKVDALISSKSSIAYACEVAPCKDGSLFSFDKIKSVAALEDKDLYYVQSILVTSSWNKNDDIFDKAEVWKAKATPEDKPTNLEHDESIIIGHITSNYPMTDDGEIIPLDTPVEELPEKYHILTGSVIYRAFSNPELKDRSENLIKEIEAGNKYVSMECYFNDFDYGLRDEATGSFKVLAREENTSYLTKHLRAYGGTGKHEGYTIGRVLKNITFSGKGFVDKPANTDSIIFSQTMLNNFLPKKPDFVKNSVIKDKPFSKSETNIMNLEETVERINKKLESVLTADAFKEVYSKASDLETKVSELNSAANDAQKAFDEKYQALEAAMKDKEEEMKKKQEMLDKMSKEKASIEEELNAANETLAGYKMQEEEMKKKEKALKRRASLVDAGLDDETAEATVDKFDHLDDESFESMTSLIAAMKSSDMKKEKKQEEEAMMMKKKASEEDIAVEASDLDNVETEEEVSLSVSDEDETSAVEQTRAALVDFVKSRLQTK